MRNRKESPALLTRSMSPGNSSAAQARMTHIAFLLVRFPEQNRVPHVLQQAFHTREKKTQEKQYFAL